MGVGCLARARHEGLGRLPSSPRQIFSQLIGNRGMQSATWFTQSMNPVHKKSKTHNALLDLLLVLNSLLLLFAHWAGSRE